MEENQNQPQSGQQPENPISDYYDGVKELEMQGYETGIRKARIALFATAVLLAIGELISASTMDYPITGEIIAIIAVESGIFIALGFWTKKRPFTAIVIGLIIFIGLWILAIAAAGVRGAIGGIIVRIIIIVYLTGAL